MNNVDKQIYLEHHGVKGMRWGVRKKISDNVDSVRRERQATADHLRREQKQIRRKLNSMSDQQLREAINRINMEKQFNDLVRTKSDSERALELLGDVGNITMKVAQLSTSVRTITKLGKKKDKKGNDGNNDKKDKKDKKGNN